VEKGLYFYKSKDDWEKGSKNDVFAFVDLSTCVVHHNLEIIFGVRASTLKIEAREWMIDGKFQDDVGFLQLESMVEGRPFPSNFLTAIKKVNLEFESAFLKKKKSITMMKQRYDSIQESKLKQEYTEEDKHEIERHFRSNSIFAMLRIGKEERSLSSNCVVLKTRKLIKLGDWKKRTVILTSEGLMFLQGHLATLIKTGQVPEEIRNFPPRTMVCLETHSCKVFTDIPADFAFEPPKSHPFPLFVLALLWTKGDQMNWRPRCFVLAFTSKETQHLWRSKIKTVINSFHYGEAVNSKLAQHYKPSSKRPQSRHSLLTAAGSSPRSRSHKKTVVDRPDKDTRERMVHLASSDRDSPVNSMGAIAGMLDSIRGSTVTAGAGTGNLDSGRGSSNSGRNSQQSLRNRNS